jgi:nucleotide-binding universal stress UspA family protein
MKVLLCADQAATEGAVRFGGQVARKLGAHMDFWLILETHEEMVRAQPLLEKERRILASIAPDVEAQTRKGLAAEILARVQEQDYDLIILTFRGRRGLKKIFPRPEAIYAIREVHVPILTIWGSRETIRKVLFCTGGSAAAEVAFAFGARIASAFGAKATVLHVRAPLPGIYVPPAGPSRGAEAIEDPEVRNRVLSALDIVAQSVPAELRVLAGNPGERIVELADTGGYDLVVLGRMDTSPVRRFLLGNVSEYVVKHSHVPVLVVPPRDGRRPFPFAAIRWPLPSER